MGLPATAALGAVRPADMGTASGVNAMTQRFGGVFAVAVVSAVFAANGHLGTPAGVTAGFRPALAVCAVLSLAGAGSALLVRRRTPAGAPGEADEAVDLLFENNPSSPDADVSRALPFFEHRFDHVQGGEAGGDAHRSGRDPMPAAAPRDTP